MSNTRKILVFVPILVISCGYVYIDRFHQFRHGGSGRLMALLLSMLLFYVWAALGIRKRRQDSFSDMLVQSSYYVYVFGVLTLTGYFILFNQVAARDWWHRLLHRVEMKDGVNMVPLLFMRSRHLLKYETVGNFFMLMPLGIYLPLLYRYLKNFFVVTLVAMLVSVSIELMQLATNSRIADIDDVILNTAGAAAGFIVYWLLFALVRKPSQQQYRMSS